MTDNQDEPVWIFNPKPFEKQLKEYLKQLGYSAPTEELEKDADRTEPKPEIID